ncbi:MAG TPA: hypothetical protein VEL47_07305, partial [Myxococcota bacterium]|nr:hypothetical protein [Myxococcota bacterium]
VYRHSLVESPRFGSDCGYYCPDVDVWQYQYKDPKTKQIITSERPISIGREFWKSPNEARIIAISLFDGKEFYYKALLQYLESFANIKKLNNITDETWGYETFTVRVYVSARNPKYLAQLGQIKNRTPEQINHHLLDLGCEIAFVDNKLAEAKKDGTFWRFAAASDHMADGQRVRFLMRDADNILTAAEMYAVADWIRSGLRYHRMHLIPICFGPLTAMLWGGSHTGPGDFVDFHEMVHDYPYRFHYGDDELFSRDLIWPRLKSIGSILTHRFQKSRLVSALASPYGNSCEEPTQEFCRKLNPHSDCVDKEIPQSESWTGVVEALGLRVNLLELVKKRPEIFNLELNREDRRFIYDAFKSR